MSREVLENGYGDLALGEHEPIVKLATPNVL
jgi:hypothetical protein